MGSVALKIDEPEPFELEVQFDGGGGKGGWSDAALIEWLRDSLELAGSLPEFEELAGEAKRRGLKWS